MKKTYCLVAAMLVAPNAAFAAEDVLARATAKAAAACKTANEIVAKNDIGTAPTDALVQGYCTFWAASQGTQASASPGRLECLKASQAAGVELVRRGLPIIGLCN